MQLLKTLHSLKQLLPHEAKIRIIFLILLQFITSIFDVFSVIFLAMILSLVSGNVIQESNIVFSSIIYLLNSNAENQLRDICLVGLFVFGFAFISNFVLIFWGSRTSHKFGAMIGNNLFSNFLNYPLNDFLKLNKSKITNQIIIEVTRISSGILNPLIKCSSQLTFTFISLTMLMIANFKLTITIITAGGFIYFLIFFCYRKLTNHYSKKITDGNFKKLSIVNNSFKDIRNGIIDDTNRQSLEHFFLTNYSVAKIRANVITIASVPRILIETVILFSMCITLLFMFDGKQIDDIDILVLFGATSLRLLPSFHGIYASIITIIQNQNGLFEVSKLFVSSENTKRPISLKLDKPHQPVKKLSLIDINYGYDDKIIFLNASCEFQKGKIYCITGPSGAGKSTLCDLITGLTKPESGQILYNNTEAVHNDIADWYSKISLLTQEVQIFDTSLQNNIVMNIWGQDIFDINQEALAQSIIDSELASFVESLEYGPDELISDDGANLSGGQKQRIGIARALYSKNQIIIMDEPTSSLDKLTEEAIIRRLDRLKKNHIIIIISHSEKISNFCDITYEVKENKIHRKT
ncbi:ABC transporter ATP-binding protein/permease [Alphaproteobacteria bacterium]|nr:ABC transporter ATP-binding protein/permease [Alphaproteobacteria bacterium]